MPANDALNHMIRVSESNYQEKYSEQVLLLRENVSIKYDEESGLVSTSGLG